MHLRQVWIALSKSKQTVMYSSAEPSLILPPVPEHADDAVTLALGSQEPSGAQGFWVAITRDDTRFAA